MKPFVATIKLSNKVITATVIGSSGFVYTYIDPRTKQLFNADMTQITFVRWR